MSIEAHSARVAPRRSVGSRRHVAALLAGLALSVGSMVLAPEARACGGEVPVSCNTDRDDARYLLKRAITAVQRTHDEALAWFSEQSHGFRTVDLYVFCIGPDGVMSAHPNADLRGTNVADLVDDTGYRFGAEMIAHARADAMSDITYRWPRLEQMKPTLKHTFYQRVSDQICAVGYYE